jgi:hypothetical protein
VNFWDFQLDPPEGLGHGPIKTDPNYPYNSQIQNGGFFAGGELRPPIVNAKDPILKPWAAQQMQATNEEVLSGKRPLPFVAQSRCWPGGVPGQLLFLQPMYFLQTPNEVWMIWERDQWVRRIHLTDKHSENVNPSWFGESIGHYEGGDTLVVDTIGLAAGDYHYIDSFRTPYTEKLHVVERFTISQDGRALTRDRDSGRSRHVQWTSHTQADLAQESGSDGGGGLRRDRRGVLLQSESPSDSAGRQTGFLTREPPYGYTRRSRAVGRSATFTRAGHRCKRAALRPGSNVGGVPLAAQGSKTGP